MVEADLHPYITNTFKDAGHWCYKIPDDMGGTKFSIKRPFDLIANIHSRGVAIEVKLLKGYQAFGLRHFQPHQPKELSSFQASNGRAFVFLIVYEPRDTRLIIFDWQWLLPRLNEGSIKKAELQDFDFIPSYKKRFDLGKWIDIFVSANPLEQL